MQLADLGRDLGDELHRARARCRSRPTRLPREVDVVVPAGRVERRPGERVAARRCRGSCGRLSWPTALITASAASVSSVPSAPRTSHRPASGRRRTTSADSDLGAEPDVLAQPERVGAVAEVVEQHVLGREVERPVVALRERVAVVVVRVVDAAARDTCSPTRCRRRRRSSRRSRTGRRPAAAGARRAAPTCPRR